MPTYEYECRECGATRKVVSSMRDYRQHIKCSCGRMMHLVISGGLGTIFKGEWNDKTRRKKREDQDIKRKARKARELKNTGKVPMEQQIKLKDRCLDD